jgi:molybdate transport system regulatory protein
LSSEGERVLRLYPALQVLQAQVLEAAEDASDLDLLGRLMLRTSAAINCTASREHRRSGPQR